MASKLADQYKYVHLLSSDKIKMISEENGRGLIISQKNVGKPPKYLLWNSKSTVYQMEMTASFCTFSLTL